MVTTDFHVIVDRGLPRWAKVTSMNSFLGSIGMREEVAPILAVCRQLVLETDSGSSNDYFRIVHAISNETVTATLGALIIAGERAQGNKQKSIWQVLIRHNEEIYGNIVSPYLQEYSDRWLFGSETGRNLIGEMAFIDALDIDIEELESKRERRPAWSMFYDRRGRNSRGYKTLRKQANEEGWKRIDDALFMRRAKVWVRAHHVFHSMALALDEVYNGPDGLRAWDESERSYWIKSLKDFDDALGRDRRNGKRY